MKGDLKNQAKDFLNLAKSNPELIQSKIISFVQYQKERANKGDICESTIRNYYKAAKLFLEMNDIILNWKKITRGMPYGREAANDRAPTVDEIKKLVEYPDRRIKAIVYTMASSGIRIGLKGFSGIAIGGIVGLDIFFFSYISGASMNPARSLAPALLSGSVGDLWLYLSATFVGTSTVALLLREKFRFLT